MDEAYSVISQFIVETCGDDKRASDLLRGFTCSSSLRSHRYMDALLNLMHSLNKIALKLTNERTSSSAQPPSSVEVALLGVIRDCLSGSEQQLNQALDELVKREDIFAPKHAKESSKWVLDEANRAFAEATPRKPSAVYVARSPRLPGLPDPPADAFGEWDEYRDDLDPGYRVRDVYEQDYFRELAKHSTASTTASIGPREDTDELNQVLMTSSEPSPIPSAIDELDMATSAAPTVLLDTCSSARPPSPTFGGITKETLKYDYMGNVSVVPRPNPMLPTRPAEINSAPIFAPNPLSNYPLTSPNPDGSTTIYDEFLLPVIHQRMRTGFETNKDFDISPGIIVGGRYKIVSFLGAAAFSKAVKAVDLLNEQGNESNELCLKIIKNDKDFFDQSLDEIKILTYLKNKAETNIGDYKILNVINFFYTKEHLFIVTELLRDNLYDFSRFTRSDSKENFFTIGHIQKIAYQILTALEFIHSSGVIHCDLKPENILFKSFSSCDIRVIDFGSSCFTTDRLSTYVQSRCYRAPEIILGCFPYSGKIDMWSLGCILAELWTGTVLFQNDSSQSLLARVEGIIGSPFPQHMLETGRNTDQLFLNRKQLFIDISSGGGQKLLQLLVPKKTNLFQRMRIDDKFFLDFLSQIFQIDPDLRISARDALQHPWITQAKYSDGL